MIILEGALVELQQGCICDVLTLQYGIELLVLMRFTSTSLRTHIFSLVRRCQRPCLEVAICPITECILAILMLASLRDYFVPFMSDSVRVEVLP